MIKKIIGYLFYGIALITIIFYAILATNPNVAIEYKITFIFIFVSCLLIYLGGVLLSKFYQNDKPLKINLWIFFILYLLFFINLTLFDSNWGRQNFLFNISNLKNLKDAVNLIPFKTVYNYLIVNFNNLTDTSTIFYNIIGNFVALMPMAFFLTLLFKKQNNFKIFFITVFSITFGIEIIQLIGFVGRFDIDDIILNVGGAIIMFGILKIKTINELIKNIFLLEKNKLDLKKVIILFSILFIIVLGFLLLIKYHNHLYQKNIDIINYRMQIIDEETNCNGNAEKFFEDELYNYYFPCNKSDKVYAIFNDNDKYLIKDLLKNNPSPYKVDIYKIENSFNYYNINYIKKEKYKYITFNVDIPNINNTYASPNTSVKIENKEIMDYKLDFKRAILDNDSYKINLFIMPIKMGSTNIEISFETNNKELIYEYEINIDKDLNVNVIK